MKHQKPLSVFDLVFQELAAYKTATGKDPVVVLLSEAALLKLKREVSRLTGVLEVVEAIPHVRVYGLPVEIVVANKYAIVVKVY